ncbi:hypothetical protein K435DRAFT_856925 [Dendrothele bispora CBS 962.96]|uniref:Uncharacterized protein n=1 Tax=Dendrothele bispora (strain CBS 962.96) TaxID=1314807 RepID=A0A4S8M7A9_DENBC|nr:hypothetical protein K435DRAFT_856925 [Dendrothele bispora CBS 962.96]
MRFYPVRYDSSPVSAHAQVQITTLVPVPVCFCTRGRSRLQVYFRQFNLHNHPPGVLSKSVLRQSADVVNAEEGEEEGRALSTGELVPPVLSTLPFAPPPPLPMPVIFRTTMEPPNNKHRLVSLFFFNSISIIESKSSTIPPSSMKSRCGGYVDFRT